MYIHIYRHIHIHTNIYANIDKQVRYAAILARMCAILGNLHIIRKTNLIKRGITQR